MSGAKSWHSTAVNKTEAERMRPLVTSVSLRCHGLRQLWQGIYWGGSMSCPVGAVTVPTHIVHTPGQ